MAKTAPFHRADILMVEDNPGDVRLAKVALDRGPLNNILHDVPDGFDALAFLHRQDRYADAPRPDLILLDLNLPRMDGRELLRTLKHDPELASIPVVIFTTSDAERDIIESYALAANCFVTKPVDFEGFESAVRHIEHFWCAVARLPPRAT